jgi:hypothetical protein
MKVFFYSPWKYVINLAGSELPLYSVDGLAERLQEFDVKIATDSYHSLKFDYRQEHSFHVKW